MEFSKRHCFPILLGLVVFLLSFSEVNVKYYLYTKENQHEPILLNINGINTVDSIDPSKPVKILTHGYFGTSTSHWIKPTKDAYMANGDTNIISVDWSRHSIALYTHSYSKCRAIGEHLAELVMNLSAGHKIPLSKFHLIGHSLGAHISGFAGKAIYRQTGQKLGRITGLDPAGLLFTEENSEYRLTPEDATFVDAIHTDTKLCGYDKPIAHVDFWPNGGKSQKGCTWMPNCSHIRASIYFYESINRSVFPAWKCDSADEFNGGKCSGNEKVFMGDRCDFRTRGNFYLNTNAESPYGII